MCVTEVGQLCMCIYITELGQLTGVAAVLRFPIDDELISDSDSDSDS